MQVSRFLAVFFLFLSSSCSLFEDDLSKKEDVAEQVDDDGTGPKDEVVSITTGDGELRMTKQTFSAAIEVKVEILKKDELLRLYDEIGYELELGEDVVLLDPVRFILGSEGDEAFSLDEPLTYALPASALPAAQIPEDGWSAALPAAALPASMKYLKEVTQIFAIATLFDPKGNPYGTPFNTQLTFEDDSLLVIVTPEMLAATAIKGGSTIVISILVVPFGSKATFNRIDIADYAYGQQKLEPIEILAVRGNGSGDDVFRNALIVEANRFDEDGRVVLIANDGTKSELSFTIDRFGQVIATLPDDLVPGSYRLKLMSLNGSATVEVEILRGEPGIGITWLGGFAEAPSDPSENDAYYDSAEGVSYIFAGGDWQVMSKDGQAGIEGLTGATGPIGPQGPKGDTGTGGGGGSGGIVITSMPVLSFVYGETYTYQVTAIGGNGALSYHLIDRVSCMKLDQTSGLFTYDTLCWNYYDDEAKVFILVNDIGGRSATQLFTLIPSEDWEDEPDVLTDPSGVMSFSTLRSDKVPDSAHQGQYVVLDNQQNELFFNFFNISRSCENNIGANYEQNGLSLVINIIEQPSSQSVECDTTIYSNQRITIKKAIYSGARYINVFVVDNRGATILNLQDFDLTALGQYNGDDVAAGGGGGCTMDVAGYKTCTEYAFGDGYPAASIDAVESVCTDGSGTWSEDGCVEDDTTNGWCTIEAKAAGYSMSTSTYYYGYEGVAVSALPDACVSAGGVWTDGDMTDDVPNLCGNGKIDEGEECDGSNLGAKACNDFDFTEGTLSCNQCKFNTTQCTMSTPDAITSDIVWSAENSPYIVNGEVRIYPGVTLTITAGTEIRFAGRYRFYVRGTLDVQGTAEAPVVFRSDAEVPQKGDWDSLYFDQDSNISLVHTEINHAQKAIELHGWTTVRGAIEECELSENVYGVYTDGVYPWELRFVNNTIHSNDYGIYTGYGLNINDSYIYGNDRGIVARFLNISCSTISGNNRGIEISDARNSAFSNNNIYDNSSYNVYLSENQGNLDASNNYWGTTDTTMIDQKIYDVFDDWLLGRVLYDQLQATEIDCDEVVETSDVSDVTDVSGISDAS